MLLDVGDIRSRSELISFERGFFKIDAVGAKGADHRKTFYSAGFCVKKPQEQFERDFVTFAAIEFPEFFDIDGLHEVSRLELDCRNRLRDLRDGVMRGNARETGQDVKHLFGRQNDLALELIHQLDLRSFRIDTDDEPQLDLSFIGKFNDSALCNIGGLRHF